MPPPNPSSRPGPAVNGGRSDPFFADAEGVLHGFQWTGQNTFIGQNVLSVVLAVPIYMLGRAHRRC
jgi:hypothetical protein